MSNMDVMLVMDVVNMYFVLLVNILVVFIWGVMYFCVGFVGWN